MEDGTISNNEYAHVENLGHDVRSKKASRGYRLLPTRLIEN